MRVELLIIDPQNDFCDSKGSLAVPGANSDCERLAKMIERIGNKIDDIHCTLDTHSRIDIGHSLFWTDSKGKHPIVKLPNHPPIVLSVEDVEQGKYRPTDMRLYNYVLEYFNFLKNNGRYAPVIWTEHCLKASWGWCVYPCVFQALYDWESQYAMVDYVTKGSNYKTEHYGIFFAEYQLKEDPGTQLNMPLIETFQRCDMILVSGQALNFCVANSIVDLVNSFGKENAKKIWIVEDTTSPVPGFDQLTDNFYKFAKSNGINFITSDKVLK